MQTNTSAALSRVQDTDIARETADLSKNQVLSQAGAAILSQATRPAGRALSLLPRLILSPSSRASRRRGSPGRPLASSRCKRLQSHPPEQWRCRFNCPGLGGFRFRESGLPARRGRPEARRGPDQQEPVDSRLRHAEYLLFEARDASRTRPTLSDHLRLRLDGGLPTDTSLVGSLVTGNATPGSYSVNVTQLAKAQKMHRSDAQASSTTARSDRPATFALQIGTGTPHDRRHRDRHADRHRLEDQSIGRPHRRRYHQRGWLLFASPCRASTPAPRTRSR